MELIDKMPNWLRYILAIPFGIICVIGMAFFISISNYLYSSDNWQNIVNFIYKNGINVIIFFYALNTMLPKFKFQITLALSIIFCILYSIVQGMSIMAGTMSIEYIVAFIEFIIFLIISCYYSYKKKFD